MTRTLTAAVESAVTADHVPMLMLVELQFASGTLRLTNASYDFAHGGHTWYASGQLISIGHIDERGSLEATGVQLVLSGVPASLVTIARTEDYQGRTAIIYFAPLSEDFLVLADPVEVFRGRMDTMPMEVAEQATISLNLEGRYLGWRQPAVRRYNHADQRAAYPEDRGFEFAEQIAAAELYWGITPGAAAAYQATGASPGGYALTARED